MGNTIQKSLCPFEGHCPKSITLQVDDRAFDEKPVKKNHCIADSIDNETR